MKIERVLAPIDFSSCSRQAAREAVAIAKKLGASVDLLHVLELPNYLIPELLVSIPGQENQTISEFAHGTAKEDVEKLLAELEETGVKITSRIAVGVPRDEIINVAAEGYDLIVMGTHGRRGLSHLFIGSVAEQVVRRAPCPVLTFKTEDEPDEAEETADS